jgi:hypothetical protein
MWVWTHVTGGSEPGSYNFGISASFINIWNAVAYSGVDTASPTYGTSSNTGSDSAYSSAGATITDADSRLVISATCNSGDGGMTAPSGMALEVDTTQLIVAGGTFGAGATGAKTGTNGVSDWGTATAVVRPAGGGGGGAKSPPPMSNGARHMQVNGIYRV